MNTYPLSEILQDVSAAVHMGLRARSLYKDGAVTADPSNYRVTVEDANGYRWVITVEPVVSR